MGKVTNYSAVPVCLLSSASKSETCLLVTGDIRIPGIFGGWPPLRTSKRGMELFAVMLISSVVCISVVLQVWKFFENLS